MILEFLSSNPFDNYRNEYFAHLSSGFKRRGVEVQWFVFGIHRSHQPNSRFLVSLSPEDVATFGRVLGDFKPEVIISNDCLDSILEAKVQETLGHVAVFVPDHGQLVFSVQLDNFLNGLPLVDTLDSRKESRFIVDDEIPDYSSTVVNEISSELITVVPGLKNCLYKRSLDSNPYFQDLLEKKPCLKGGCSFCLGNNYPDTWAFDNPMEELAAVQITRAMETLPWPRRNGLFLIEDSHVFFKQRELIATLVRHSVRGVNLLFSCRIDEFLGMADVIRSLIPICSENEIKLSIVNMGVENFSDTENLRLNKGIRAKDALQALEVIERLEAEAPDQFSFHDFGGFGYILFTPWTTFDDLLINIDYAEKFRIPDFSYFFISRLFFLPGTPIMQLAELEGLSSESFNTVGGLMLSPAGHVTSDKASEVCWEFRDPLVGLIYSLVFRMYSTGELPEGDPALPSVRDLLQSIPRDRVTPSHIIRASIDLLSQSQVNNFADLVSGLKASIGCVELNRYAVAF
jgi:hypothetical protein